MTVFNDGGRGNYRVLRILFCICLFGMVLLVARPVQADTPQQGTRNKAGIVIQFDDGDVEEYCVDLGSDGIATGEEVLRETGLPVIAEYSGLGAAVCKVGNTGCNFPADGCFCACTMLPGDTCTYWAYSHLDESEEEWVYANIGTTNYEVTEGSVEGWAWGAGRLNEEGSAPPVRTFDQICAAVAPTLTPTATPSATLSPTPSMTATASVTATPTTPPPTATSDATGTLIPATATATSGIPTATSTGTAMPSATTVIPSATAEPTDTPVPQLTPESEPPTATIEVTEVAEPTATEIPATETVVVILPTATSQVAPTIGSPNVTVPTPTLVGIAVVPTNPDTPIGTDIAGQTDDAGNGDWWLYGVFGVIVVGLIGIAAMVWRYRDGA